MALELHGLHRDDRAWLLAALPTDAVARVQPLLEELSALGIPAAGRAPQASEIPSAERCSIHRRERIAMATDHAIWAMLREEPLAIAGWLLALGPWPWQAGLMRRFSPAEQAQVAEARERMLSPCVADALLDAVSDRLALKVEPKARGALKLRALLGWKP